MESFKDIQQPQCNDNVREMKADDVVEGKCQQRRDFLKCYLRKKINIFLFN